MPRIIGGFAALIFMLMTFPAFAQEATRLRFLIDWRFEGHVSPFLVALDKGFFAAFSDPEGAIESLRKYNPLAKADIEVERLKLVNEYNYLTEDVRKNGFGNADIDRLNRSIDQLAITFPFKNKPKAEDVFTGEFLPPVEERMFK